MKRQHRKLLSAARLAMKKAYSPYSKIKVGAALLSDSGKIFCGANVENASYGLTICAERAAVAVAVAAGARKFIAVAVAWNKKGQVSPCGACLQVLSEFCAGMEVITAAGGGNITVRKLSDMLPDAFQIQLSSPRQEED